MDKKLTTPQILILAGGAACLLGSFLPWISVEGFGVKVTRSAWSDGLFPTYTWVGIFGTVMAAHVALTTFASTRFPDRILGFEWRQIHLILGCFAALLAVSFLIAGEEFGFGYFLSLLGAAALVVGAWMLYQGRDIRPAGTTDVGGYTPPPPAPPPPSV
jgi:hypothetical protein